MPLTFIKQTRKKQKTKEFRINGQPKHKFEKVMTIETRSVSKAAKGTPSLSPNGDKKSKTREAEKTVKLEKQQKQLSTE